MSLILKTWTMEDVHNAKDPSRAFCEYVQQTLGVPYPTGKDIAILRKKAKDLFALYPQADWRTMCRIAHWCKARKRRPSRVYMVIDKYRDAWAAGFIPELNAAPVELGVEEGITAALQIEHGEFWRRRLIMASSPEMKRKALVAWQSERQHQIPISI